MGVMSLMGPQARELLQSLTPNDVSDTAFPFATSQIIELGYALVRASRITYVGELGWELYVPTEFMLDVYDTLTNAGVSYGLVHAGYHALNSLRIEKAYRHWGHDITDEDTPLEAGLGFAVKLTSRVDSSGVRHSCGNGKRECANASYNSSSNPPSPCVPQRTHMAGRLNRGMHSLRNVRPLAGRGHWARLRYCAPRGMHAVGPTITTSRSPAFGTRPPRRYGPCTIRIMRASSDEHCDCCETGE